MPEISKILFALELTEISDKIAPWVDKMARRFKADIHVLHVVPELDFYGLAYANPPWSINEQQEVLKAAEEKARDFCESHFKEGTPLRITASQGDPADVIVDYIKSEGISMAVLGTHGRRGLNRAVFGSVVDRVLRFSPVPVLCVNPFPVESVET